MLLVTSPPKFKALDLWELHARNDWPHRRGPFFLTAKKWPFKTPKEQGSRKNRLIAGYLILDILQCTWFVTQQRIVAQNKERYILRFCTALVSTGMIRQFDRTRRLSAAQPFLVLSAMLSRLLDILNSASRTSFMPAVSLYETQAPLNAQFPELNCVNWSLNFLNNSPLIFCPNLLLERLYQKVNARPANDKFQSNMSGTDARTSGIVVVGLGRAGKARVRDLKQKVLGENAVLRGVISR